MQKPLGSTPCFHQFQNDLLDCGQVDLADLEKEILQLLRNLFEPPASAKPFDQYDYLGKLLLLRYCIGWAVASGEDLPPLVEDDKCYAYELMEPHRRQMARYAVRFPKEWKDVLSHPEKNLDAAKYESLRAFLDTKRSPDGKGAVYMPALLFQEQLDYHAVRDMIPAEASSKAALWGKHNINDLVNGSRRSRYWMDRLIRQTGIGTSKEGKSKE